MYPETCNPAKNHPAYRFGRKLFEDTFRCQQCNALVTTQSMFSGVNNRNHCPYCLWSRHVDLFEAGDRLSACKSPMEPIGLTVKQRQNKYGSGNSGELMLIHHCEVCDKFSINRIAADDISDKLLEVFHASEALDSITRGKLEVSGIQALQGEDHQVVMRQLYGINESLNDFFAKKYIMNLGYSKEVAICITGEDCFPLTTLGARGKDRFAMTD